MSASPQHVWQAESTVATATATADVMPMSSGDANSGALFEFEYPEIFESSSSMSEQLLAERMMAAWKSERLRSRRLLWPPPWLVLWLRQYLLELEESVVEELGKN